MKRIRSLGIKLDRKSSVPLLDQIKDQVTFSIASKSLFPGDPLPSKEALASSLQVSTDVVAAAYRALAEDGLIESYKNFGTFIAKGAENSIKATHALVFSRLDKAIEECTLAGLDGKCIQDHVKAVLSATISS